VVGAVAVAALTVPGVRGWLGTVAERIAAPRPNSTQTQPSADAARWPRQGARTPRTGNSAGKPLLASAPVTVDVPGFFSWALMDRRNGSITGSANHIDETTTTESMVKIWLASDYLWELGQRKPEQARLTELSTMIRDSDDQAAEDIYQVNGANATINRMITTCGLTETTLFEDWWSLTEISARDAVRLGLCVADGRAAGPEWTDWVLSEMRQVRGEGRFGIIDGLPPALAQQTAIKNGWTEFEEDDTWHVTCLAVHDDWILAVLLRFPLKLGLSFGAGICKSVTQQLQRTS
jgi:hypothetical protein